jgi:tetratricopeptide (TPR) repeat protein
MSAKYYYAAKDKDKWKGPVTLEELRSLAAREELIKSDVIWTEGMDAWQPAEKTPAVFEGRSGNLKSLGKSIAPSPLSAEEPTNISRPASNQSRQEPPLWDEIVEHHRFKLPTDDTARSQSSGHFGGHPTSTLENRQPDAPISRLSSVMGECVKCHAINPGDSRFCSECGALLYEACPACKVENRVGTKYCRKCGADVAKLNRIANLRQQAVELQQHADQVPDQMIQLLTEARQKLQSVLTESPTDETAKNGLSQLDGKLCAAFMTLAHSKPGIEAKGIYGQLLQVFPNHPEAVAALACIEQALPEAKAQIEKLTEVGEFSEAQKQVKGAIESLGGAAELLELQQRAGVGATLLDQARSQSGCRAVWTWRKLLEEFPDNKEAATRLREIERGLQELKNSANHLIQAGNYKLASQELDKTQVEFGTETELWKTDAQTETASTGGVIETLLRELFNLRKQAQAGQDRLAELTEQLIPGLVQERKFVAVLECIDELVQMGADETFVRPIRQQADSAIQEAGALAEQGGQLLAAKKPAEAIKVFNKALQICADFSRATEGVASAAQAIFNKNAMIVAVSVVVIVILLRIGIPAVHNWKANSAWAQAQQDIKLAGDNQSRIKDSYQKYLASFPDGKKAEIAQQAVAQIQQAEDARQQKLAEEERQWELAKAEAERQQELAEHERQRQAHYDSGVEKQAKGDLDGAIADFAKVIELAPKEADAYFNRGTAETGKSDWDGAIADFDIAVQLKPEYADAYGWRGVVKEAKGDLDGALADYNKAIELNPGLAKAYDHRGKVKQAKGDQDGAMTDYSKAIGLKPDFAEAFNGRGITECSKGDLDNALTDFNRSVELKPDYANAYFNRGIVKRGKGDLAGALTDYNKAVELDPKLADQNWLDKLAEEIRQNKLAEEKQRQLAKQESERLARIEQAKQAYDLGVTNEAKGDLAGAMAEYSKAIELNPGLAEAYYHRGTMRQTKGDLDGAVADYNKDIEIAPNDSQAYYHRGNADAGKGNWDGAIADFTKFIEIAPNNEAAVYFNRGNAEARKGYLQAAIVDYTHYVQLKPDYANAYCNRGKVEEANGDLGAALADYNKAVELDPKLADPKWQQRLTEETNQQKSAQKAQRRELATQQERVVQAEKNNLSAEDYFNSARAADRNRAYAKSNSLIILYGNQAISRYQNFIRLASPDDPRISEAQQDINDIQTDLRALQ